MHFSVASEGLIESKGLRAGAPVVTPKTPKGVPSGVCHAVDVATGAVVCGHGGGLHRWPDRDWDSVKSDARCPRCAEKVE